MFAGIVLVGYSPLGSPRRLEKNPADPVVLEDPVIREIATKHKTTAAQVSLTYKVLYMYTFSNIHQ